MAQCFWTDFVGCSEACETSVVADGAIFGIYGRGSNQLFEAYPYHLGCDDFGEDINAATLVVARLFFMDGELGTGCGWTADRTKALATSMGSTLLPWPSDMPSPYECEDYWSGETVSYNGYAASPHDPGELTSLEVRNLPLAYDAASDRMTFEPGATWDDLIARMPGSQGAVIGGGKVIFFVGRDSSGRLFTGCCGFNTCY